MYEKHVNPSLKELSTLGHRQLQKSRIVDYSHSDQQDLDFDSDTDNSISGDDDIEINDNDGDALEDIFLNVSSTNFQGMCVLDSINLDLANSSFVVNINGKQTAT